MRMIARKQTPSRQSDVSGLIRSAGLLPGSRASVSSIHQLHRMVGNHAVQQLLQNAAAPVSGGAPKQPGIAELTVSSPGDSHEQAANRLADEVMRTPADQLPPTGVHGRTETAAASPVVDDVLSSPGQPMSAADRAFFEPRFGHDLQHVRLHTGLEAQRSADALNAEAYTVGSHIVLGEGKEAVGTSSGRHLLAHELAHVAQQSTGPTAGLPDVQRQARPQQQTWLPELDAILPGSVGLVARINRVTTLVDIFGEQLLEEHVRLIHADAAATRFTLNTGVPGIVALYDTRRGNQLDVPAAQRALTNMADRYKHDSLQRLNVKPDPDVSPSFWFQDPASQGPGNQPTGRPTSIRQQRAQVHIERQLSKVGSDVFVRFAYPETEVSRDGASRRITNAKQQILQAMAHLIADLNSLPPAANVAERREQERTRARLREATRGLSSSTPLNVYIATEPTPEELVSGLVAAYAGRVFVNLQDVGDPARLDAAIRTSLLMLRGGSLPTQGGVQEVPGISQAGLQRTLLHESLHVLLIRQSSDANAIWEANQARLTAQGSPSATPKFTELVRKYLIAQEEVFTYENEASLYPPVSPEKAPYDTFITNVERFLNRRQITLNPVRRSIPVTQRVGRQPVAWSITYRVPAGTVNLTADDIQILDLLLSAYPLATR